MKIALCSDWVYPSVGGVQSHITGLATELARMGHEVVIVTKETDEDDPDYDPYDGAVREIRAKRMADLKHVLMPPSPIDLRKLLRAEEPDVVHAHHAFTPTPLLSINVAKELGVPSVLTNHSITFGNASDLIWTPMSQALFPLRKYINDADRVIAVSGSAAEFIGRFLDNKRVTVIPNGVNVARFAEPKAANVDGVSVAALEHPMIFSVGRLSFRKGFHLLVEAMPLVLKKHPDAVLYIAGKGGMMPYLNLLAEYLDIKSHVELLGFVSDEALPLLYGASDVFALPSLASESFGITLIEAMSARKPIVASKIGGVPEIIRDSHNGLLFDPWHSKGLAERVNTLLDDEEYADRLGNNAHRDALEKYDWPVVVRRVEKVYEELV
jgi:glycosyltransferase involved in cell wall biosynthesis